MEGTKLRVELSLNQTVRIDELFNKIHDVSFEKIIHGFEYHLSKHFFQFGTKPYYIEYAPAKGYILRASALIGKISTENFELILNPKFEGLSLGKCLAMAQNSNSSLLNIASNDLTKSLISTKYEYSTYDYLGFGLIDAVNTIVNNGLARTFREVVGESTKLRGTIALNETISAGKGLFKPFINDLEADYDIFPNRLIKTALSIVVASTSNSELKNAANVFLGHFKEVNILDRIEALNSPISFLFNLPRIDYEKAILYSNSIIEGGYIDTEGDALDMPSITLDLDKVFEKYVASTFVNMLSKERFEVLYQPKIDHQTVPLFNNKKIVPDIVIKDKKFNKLFVIDTKNKYSELTEDGIVNISNADIFQITYYCKTLNTKTAILLFPTVNPKFQFPIKGSESDASFATKCDAAFVKLKNLQAYRVFDVESIELYIYHIDLGGSMFNTEKSIASLCQLLAYISLNEK